MPELNRQLTSRSPKHVDADPCANKISETARTNDYPSSLDIRRKFRNSFNKLLASGESRFRGQLIGPVKLQSFGRGDELTTLGCSAVGLLPLVSIEIHFNPPNRLSR